MPAPLGSASSASDGSHFNAPKTTDPTVEDEISLSGHGSLEDMPGPTRKKRLFSLTGRTKAKTKKLFSLDGTEAGEQSEDDQEDPLDILRNDPAFNSRQVIKKKRLRPAKTADKMLGAIQSLGNAVVHPVKAAKVTATRTTASQLSRAERPFLSQKADVEFLQAHDNLQRAESKNSTKRGTSDEEQESLVDGHRDRVREMEEHRESLRVAWTTSRHVVRVVTQKHINFPNNEYFVRNDEHGNFMRYEWLKWLGYNLVYYSQGFSAQYIDDFEELSFDIDSSKRYLERLIIASSPWQSWVMNVRAVYRWENPRITGQWFALYVFLWYTQHIVGFLYFYIMYIVLVNRYYPTNVESLRESQRRAFDSSASAIRFSELIDKHGRNDWLDPVMDSLGPYIQLQLGAEDMANMLEVFSNFYHWKDPRKTVASLSFFGSCFLVSLLADMQFCMHVAGFIVGFCFFLCWPVSSHYPKYRYLVSPFKWMLWDIPTNAEWSFAYLRRQAQITRERINEKKVEKGHFRELANPAADVYRGSIRTVPKIMVRADDSEDEENTNGDKDGWYSACSTTSSVEASDIRSFRCQAQKVGGRLVIYSNGIRFVRSLSKKELWKRDYIDLAEVIKAEGSTMSSLASLSRNQLEIICVDGSKFRLKGIEGRDELFNCIIAYSGMKWQSLQIRSNTEA